jgi:hypothetical protein
MTNVHNLADECLGLSEIAGLEPRPLSDGTGWCVEITWSDGGVEIVGTFGLESTARDWIEWDAPKFLRDCKASTEHGEPPHHPSRVGRFRLIDE